MGYVIPSTKMMPLSVAGLVVPLIVPIPEVVSDEPDPSTIAAVVLVPDEIALKVDPPDALPSVNEYVLVGRLSAGAATLISYVPGAVQKLMLPAPSPWNGLVRLSPAESIDNVASVPVQGLVGGCTCTHTVTVGLGIAWPPDWMATVL